MKLFYTIKLLSISVYMRYLLILVFFVMNNFALVGQNYHDNQIENLTQLKADNKIDSVNMLAKEIIAGADSIKNHTVVGRAYYYLGWGLIQKTEYDSAHKAYDQAIKEFEQSDDSSWLGILYLEKGYEFRSRNIIDTAIALYNVAYEIFHQLDDTLYFGVVNDHLGHMHTNIGDYYKALNHFQEGIIAFKRLGISVNVGAEYNAMGLIYRKTGDRDKEIHAYQSAIELLKDKGDNVYLGEAMCNLSELYLDDGKIDEAFELLERAKTIFENINHQPGLVSYYAVMSYYYLHKSSPEYQNVIEFGITGANLAEEAQGYRQFSDACYYIGLAYRNLGDYSKSEKWLLKGYQTAEENSLTPELARISNELSRLYNALGKNEQAYTYLRQHLVLNDSLASTEKVKAFTRLDLSFQHRQEQFQDSLLQAQEKQNMIFAHKKELQQKQTIQLILIFSVGILLLIGTFIIFTAKRTRRQAVELDEKNKIINKSLHEKELLLKEIHHRVKNNFQTISSLLELQSKDVTDQKAISNIHEGQSRIKSLALIHQKLYQNEDLAIIDFQDYLIQLCRQNLAAFRLDYINFSVHADDIKLDIDTSIPLGLILNELITNSCKYAFKEAEKGEIKIHIEKLDAEYQLTYFDSGPGLPQGFDIERATSLGLRLVKRLTKQLHGSLNYINQNPGVFTITFKDVLQRKQVD